MNMKKLGTTILAAFMLLQATSFQTVQASNKEDLKEGSYRHYYDEFEYEEVNLLQDDTQNLISTTPSKKEFLSLMKESTIKKPQNFNICMFDSFKVKETDTYVHGDKVKMFIDKYKYTDKDLGKKVFNYIEFNAKKINLFGNADKMQDCDIMNISMTFESLLPPSKLTLSSMDNFLTKTSDKDYLMVFSAGNKDKNTEEQTNVANYYKYYNQRDRFLLIGQLDKYGPNNYLNMFAKGEQVDYMVGNYRESIGDNVYAGTSFASPVITGTLANLMYAGFTRQEAVSLLGHEEVYKDTIKTYPVFSEEKTYQNAIDALLKKDPVLYMKYKLQGKPAKDKFHYTLKYLNNSFVSK